MSLTDDYKAIVARLRGWGFNIREEPGCYGRSNGSSWTAGRPEGHVNHHYVCSLQSSPQSYIDGLVANLTNGNVVNWFADVNGRGYLIGTGPMNHSGTGNSSVLDRVRKDQPPPGPATAAGNMSGNQALSGCEAQHPGDSTPWPTPLVDVMIAINAATFLQFGYSANRAIHHYEWTSRKVDCSAAGGPSSTAAGNELRRRVAERMKGTAPTPPPDQGDDDLPLNDDDKNWIRDTIRGQLNTYFANGEGNPQSGRIVQATTTALNNQNIPARVWDTVMPTHSTIVNGVETATANRKARDTVASTATGVTRVQLKP